VMLEAGVIPHEEQRNCGERQDAEGISLPAFGTYGQTF
jgi:hypothetical protein